MIINTHYHQILSVSDEMIKAILPDCIHFSKVVYKKYDMESLTRKAKEV